MNAAEPGIQITDECVTRFVDRVICMSDGCWAWAGAVATNGYGRFRLSGSKTIAAHRFAWLWLKGPIPPGLVMDHLCRNRRCVNPDHLEPVTTRENLRRGLQFALKTHCKHGHVYVAIKHGNNLWCRDCKKAHDHRSWLRRKARLHTSGVVKARKGANRHVTV